jgi:hypothetical protein
MKLMHSPLDMPELSHLPLAERKAIFRRARWRPWTEWGTWLSLLLALAGLFVARIPVFLVMKHYGDLRPPRLPPPVALALIALWVFATFVTILLLWVRRYFRCVERHVRSQVVGTTVPS